MHWRNSNFQIAHFLAGKCHTIDGAYKMLRELREDRDVAIRTAESSNLRVEAKKLRAEAVLSNGATAVEKLEARADLSEIEASADQCKSVYEQGLRERDFIDACIAKVEPLRKYRHLPEHEAHQACQQDEWKLELIHRAETFLMANGSIPQDQLSTMMAHPDFKSEIAPRIDKLIKMERMSVTHLESANSVIKLLE